VIASAQCGVIADPDDARAIADAILRLKQSPELRERLGANGRAEAVRAYSRDAILYKYEELLKEL
jgi:glycosyltransferase involved in cell wall biosynthesis